MMMMMVVVVVVVMECLMQRFEPGVSGTHASRISEFM
jgi:hypothetical protein